MPTLTNLVPGILLCIGITVAALLLHPLVPMGAVTTAIILGIIIGNTFKPGTRTVPGITWSEKRLLTVAIGLLGTRLDFTVLAGLGYYSVLLVVSGIAVTLALVPVAAKLTGLPRRFALLLGIGSAVCGSSAIAAAAPVLRADEEETGLSVAVVNLLGTVGIFLLPAIGTIVLKLGDVNSGILAGNTLQAVGQVVAAGFGISDTAGQAATVVKMARILMLGPLLLVLAALTGRQHKEPSGSRIKVLRVPPFIIGFLAMALVASFKIMPTAVIFFLGQCGKYMLITAMAGIGLKITFRSILRDGSKALAAGSIIFLCQIIFSAVLILTLL